MLKLIREITNTALLSLEHFGENKVPSGFKNTYDVVVSFILIVITLAGIFSVLSFLSVANLVILAFVITIIGASVWVAKNFGDNE